MSDSENFTVRSPQLFVGKTPDDGYEKARFSFTLKIPKNLIDIYIDRADRCTDFLKHRRNWSWPGIEKIIAEKLPGGRLTSFDQLLGITNYGEQQLAEFDIEMRKDAAQHIQSYVWNYLTEISAYPPSIIPTPGSVGGCTVYLEVEKDRSAAAHYYTLFKEAKIKTTTDGHLTLPEEKLTADTYKKRLLNFSDLPMTYAELQAGMLQYVNQCIDRDFPPQQAEEKGSQVVEDKGHER